MAQKYMFVLFDDESFFDTHTPETWESALKLHTEFASSVEAAGARILGGEALERSSTATTLRGNYDDAGAKSDPIVTDGPFIETKEALGGFYLVEARDLDQALELAKLCPSSNIEIRPLMDTAAPPSDL